MLNYDLIAYLNSITEGVQSFEDILHRLPGKDIDLDDNMFGVWVDGNTIFCLDEYDAEDIADWLEGFPFMEGYVVKAGYFDRLEDEQNDEVDEYTDLAWVAVDKRW